MVNNKNNLIPNGAKPLQEKAFAYGEVTGHSHSLQGAIGTDFQIYEKDGVRFCEMKKPSIELRHEEHLPQTIRKTDFPKGMEIRIVQEYDHFAEEARDVLD